MNTIKIPFSTLFLFIALPLATLFAFFYGYHQGRVSNIGEIHKWQNLTYSQALIIAKVTSEQEAFDQLQVPQNIRKNYSWSKEKGFTYASVSESKLFWAEVKERFRKASWFLGVSIFFGLILYFSKHLGFTLNDDKPPFYEFPAISPLRAIIGTIAFGSFLAASSMVTGSSMIQYL